MSGAVVVVRQNRMIRAFRAAGATAPETAVDPESIGCRKDWIFRRMVSGGVFVEVQEDRFYVSEEGVARFRRMRSLRMGVVLLLAMLLGLAALFFNR